MLKAFFLPQPVAIELMIAFISAYKFCQAQPFREVFHFIGGYFVR